MSDSTAAARQTLLFIPDISGFTSFVNETEITHSQHIIAELLEVIVDANDIGLEVSSFEGDAILFFREGVAPTAAELLAQVQRMYVRFHAHLKIYEAYRICHCGACSTANRLQIKFVAHYGPVSRSTIRDHATLFGRDVIVAHRLLKNDVPVAEYVLISQDLLSASKWVHLDQAAWCHPETIDATYDFGSIEYTYIPLDPLADRVPEPTSQDFGLGAAASRFGSRAMTIDAPLEFVFNVVSDLSIRHLWLEGLKDTDQLNSRITRNGSTHRCVINSNAKDPFFVTHSVESTPDLVAFKETDHRFGLESIFVLKRVAAATTEVEITYLLKSNFFKEMLLRMFFKRTLLRNLKKSGDRLNAYCGQLEREGRQPLAQIVLESRVVEKA